MNVAELFRIAMDGDPDPLARYILNNGDLSRLGWFEREYLVKAIRGELPARRGRPKKWERDREICMDIAFLNGNGLPAYTDTEDAAKFKSVPAVQGKVKDACTVVEEMRGLREGAAREIWRNRDKDDPELKGWYECGKRFKDGLPEGMGPMYPALPQKK